METNLYCAICWQEFNHPKEHAAPSSYAGERLNGHCAGDIRTKERDWKPKAKREASPLLDLDSSEPIILK